VPKCLLDTSAPAKKFETLRHQTHGAEMSWVRSVLGPKCPYTAGAVGQRAWPGHLGETQYKNICSWFGRCALCYVKLNSLLLFIYDDNIRLVRHFIK